LRFDGLRSTLETAEKHRLRPVIHCWHHHRLRRADRPFIFIMSQTLPVLALARGGGIAALRSTAGGEESALSSQSGRILANLSGRLSFVANARAVIVASVDDFARFLLARRFR
jgi:hypothetical protein